jgi:hypothetical protein
VELIAAAVAASAITSAWWSAREHLARNRAHEATCRHDEGAAFLYHSLYREGRLWNRQCWRCGKHEARFPGNWPPPGARLAKGEREPGRRPPHLGA